MKIGLDYDHLAVEFPTSHSNAEQNGTEQIPIKRGALVLFNIIFLTDSEQENLSGMENPGDAPYAAGYPAQGPYQQLLQQHKRQLQVLWTFQREECAKAHDFKSNPLPLARIRKIMKADDDVHMISVESPILFAKACELFILELTLRSWFHVEENKRQTLKKNDIAVAISRTDKFDYLVEIVPRDNNNDEAAALWGNVGQLPAAGGVPGVPYYYPPMVHQPMIRGPAVDPGVYLQAPPPPSSLLPWSPAAADDGCYTSGGGGSSGQANLDEQG
ncbi:nuclear transcription factor Y subunit C-1-like [Andrographis paniculata]|uniref:nuclear transcription factor Y subunit C-1-like n=1 Tax=Andrographis paniculata TaxID=175694 RepID=UPI0021E96102|nr:nuclear transcription factor Y subunit C-1-like [Andrographis paniculata]